VTERNDSARQFERTAIFSHSSFLPRCGPRCRTLAAPFGTTHAASSQRGAVATPPSANGQPVTHIVRPAAHLARDRAQLRGPTKDLLGVEPACPSESDPHVGPGDRVVLPRDDGAADRDAHRSDGARTEAQGDGQAGSAGRQAGVQRRSMGRNPSRDGPVAPAPSTFPAPATANDATTSDPVWPVAGERPDNRTFERSVRTRDWTYAGKPGDSVIASAVARWCIPVMGSRLWKTGHHQARRELPHRLCA